jgi:hypothetical protein
MKCCLGANRINGNRLNLLYRQSVGRDDCPPWGCHSHAVITAALLNERHHSIVTSDLLTQVNTITLYSFNKCGACPNVSISRPNVTDSRKI